MALSVGNDASQCRRCRNPLTRSQTCLWTWTAVALSDVTELGPRLVVSREPGQCVVDAVVPLPPASFARSQPVALLAAVHQFCGFRGVDVEQTDSLCCTMHSDINGVTVYDVHHGGILQC